VQSFYPRGRVAYQEYLVTASIVVIGWPIALYLFRVETALPVLVGYGIVGGIAVFCLQAVRFAVRRAVAIDVSRRGITVRYRRKERSVPWEHVEDVAVSGPFANLRIEARKPAEPVTVPLDGLTSAQVRAMREYIEEMMEEQPLDAPGTAGSMP
jgi:hypothetical protein